MRMTRLRAFTLASALPVAMIAAQIPSAASASGAAVLAAHRAVYDLSLVRASESTGLQTAVGRIVIEITGSACDGYAQNVRQVVEIEGQESPRMVLDYRSSTFETGDGKSLRFTRDNRKNSEPDVVEGKAEASTGNLTVRTTKPERKTFTFASDVLFPSLHVKKIIEAAQAGESRFQANVFDGSDEPDKVYDAVAIIGGAAKSELDEPSRKAKLEKMPRWPVLISYFEMERGDQSPLHSVGFELFENGVARKLSLDYGDFALKGELKQLEVLKPATCDH